MVQRISTGRGAFRVFAALAAGALVAVGLTAVTTAADATTKHVKSASRDARPAASICGDTAQGAARPGNIAGVVRPASTSARCVNSGSPAAEPHSFGQPPLLYNGGHVMGATSAPIVLTPIYWVPSGHPMGPNYRSILSSYISDVAADSGQHTNVFSTLPEYYQIANGQQQNIHYNVQAGTPIVDTNPLPANGCTVLAADTSNIYGDLTGYDACLDDDQLIAETENVVNAKGLPRDFDHMYILFLPKGVESCFFPGSNANGSGNVCTINHEDTAGYCAYHNFVPNDGLIYGNLPFPIFQSPVGFTCGSEAKYPVNQRPNGNTNADVEVSPTSHEIMEAITDPEAFTVPGGGWYDILTYENGDECAYQFGHTQGAFGQRYNQTINGNHYLTQLEFSNANFAATGGAGGCLAYE